MSSQDISFLNLTRNDATFQFVSAAPGNSIGGGSPSQRSELRNLSLFSKIHNSQKFITLERSGLLKIVQIFSSFLSMCFYFIVPQRFPNGHLLKLKYVVKNSILGGLKVAVWKLLKGNKKKNMQKNSLDISKHFGANQNVLDSILFEL